MNITSNCKPGLKYIFPRSDARVDFAYVLFMYINNFPKKYKKEDISLKESTTKQKNKKAT